jgi:hypothetical protein
MIGHPKYKRSDVVTFKCRDDVKTGTIYIVDSWGTFEQNDEPSYDIMVESENCLYKHIRESWIDKCIGQNKNTHSPF